MGWKCNSIKQKKKHNQEKEIEAKRGRKNAIMVEPWVRLQFLPSVTLHRLFIPCEPQGFQEKVEI